MHATPRTNNVCNQNIYNIYTYNHHILLLFYIKNKTSSNAVQDANNGDVYVDVNVPMLPLTIITLQSFIALEKPV